MNTSAGLLTLLVLPVTIGACAPTASDGPEATPVRAYPESATRVDADTDT